MKEFLALPKQLQLREAMSFVARVLESAIYPFMAMYYVHYFGAFWTGILMMATKGVGLLTSLYGGHLADVVGRKKVIDWGNGVVALGYLIMTLANIPGHVLPLLTFVGILLAEAAGSFAWPAIDAMIIDLTDDSNRRFVYTIHYWLINVSVMLGAGIAGLFYDSYFFSLLLVLALISLVNFYLAWRYFHETKPEYLVATHTAKLFDSFKSYGQVFTDKIFLTYTAGIMLNSVVWQQIDTFVPVHLKEHFETIVVLGHSLTAAKMLSVMVFVNTLLIVLLMTTMNRWTKPLRLVPQLWLGGALFALGVFMSMWTQTLWPLLFAATLYTIGEMIYIPASQVLRADLMDGEKLGVYSGFMAMAQPVAAMLASGLVSVGAMAGNMVVYTLYLVAAVLSLCLMARSAHQKGIR